MHELNGAPLPPQHGFPLRLVVPGWYGMTNVKWLESITLVNEPFAGYQQRKSYRVRQEEDEEGEPLTRIAPRALMVPRDSRVPDARTDRRARSLHDRGSRVVGLGRDLGRRRQRRRRDVARGNPRCGREPVVLDAMDIRLGAGHDRALRAPLPPRSDRTASERVDPPWNLGGYANNAVQRVVVTVRD